MALVQEILLEPRWDEKEFARIKTSTINGIKRSDANPNVIANRVYSKRLYGENHPLAYSTSGTVESVEAITMQDLKDYYNNYFSPSVSRFHVVGDISESQALASLEGLKENVIVGRLVPAGTGNIKNRWNKKALEDDNKFLSEQEKIEASETPVNQ